MHDKNIPTSVDTNQKPRFHLQVISRDEDERTPDIISYKSHNELSIEIDASLPVNMGGGYGDAALFLSGANLLLNVAHLALGVLTHAQVRQANRKLDHVLRQQALLEHHLNAISGRLDEIGERVKKIESHVAEERLHKAIDYLVKKYTFEGEIHVYALAEALLRELDDFSTLFGIGGFQLGSGLGLTFSAPTRDLLGEVFRVLYTLRLYVLGRINREVEGDPVRSIRTHPIYDYWPPDIARPEKIALYQVLEPTLRARRKQLQKKLSAFSSWDFGGWIKTNLTGYVIRELGKDDEEAVRLAVELPFRISSSVEEGTRFYEQFRAFWLWETSAGLLWRTRWEAQFLLDGYATFVFPNGNGEESSGIPMSARLSS